MTNFEKLENDASIKNNIITHLTWLFFNSSSNCLIRDFDQAFIFRNLASDLLASSVFCFAWAAMKRVSLMKWCYSTNKNASYRIMLAIAMRLAH